MIQRLNYKQLLDCIFFFTEVKDEYNDFYVTIDRNRIFLTNTALLEKLLKTQEVYGYYNSQLKGLLVIYREKGFRPYIKLLCDNKETAQIMIKWLVWIFPQKEFYIKIKKNNYMLSIVQRYGFYKFPPRGNEILLVKKAKNFSNNSKGDNKNGQHSSKD